MTLVALWKDRSGVLHLASDSCVSFGASPPANVGVKIAVVDVAIFGPTPEGGVEPHLMDYRIGIATIGSVVTTHTAVATLRHSLRRLQTVVPVTEVATEELAKVACDVLGAVSAATCQALFEKGLGELILVGHCPKAGVGKAFLIQCPTPATALPSFSEVELSPRDVRFFGSGSLAAQTLVPTGTVASNFDPLRTVKAVIDDPAVSEVDGALQYGRLDPHRFEVLAVRGFNANHDNKTIHIYISIGGLEVEPGLGSGASGNLYRRLGFIDPWWQEINRLLDEGYQAPP
jgi:hypothetical protein